MDPTPLHPALKFPPLKASERRWRDLRFGRLFASLATAASPHAVLLVVGVFVLFSLFGVNRRPPSLTDYACFLLVPIAWLPLSGLAYVYSIALLRGRIRRAECLLLGCGSAFFLPAVLIVAISLVTDRGAFPVNRLVLLGYIPFGLATFPFGLLSGWIFWRLGVRPAKTPTQDFAAVFD